MYHITSCGELLPAADCYYNIIFVHKLFSSLIDPGQKNDIFTIQCFVAAQDQMAAEGKQLLLNQIRHFATLNPMILPLARACIEQFLHKHLLQAFVLLLTHSQLPSRHTTHFPRGILVEITWTG